MLDENSPAVQAHLSIVQSAIERMATNSASSKTWCITLVAAILVIFADKSDSRFAYLAVVPTVLFCVLDAYYLAIEKGFREAYEVFITLLHNQQVTLPHLYVVKPAGGFGTHLVDAFRSFSVLPFYVVLVAIIILAQQFVLKCQLPETPVAPANTSTHSRTPDGADGK